MSADKQSQMRRRLFSEDRLAYMSILFTVCMGAATAFTLSRVDYLSEGPRALKLLLAIDVVALLVLSDASSFFCFLARFMLLGSFFTWVYFSL